MAGRTSRPSLDYRDMTRGARPDSTTEPGLLMSIRMHLEAMPVALRTIGRYVLAHPETVTRQNMNQLSAVARSSPASVVRFCRALGLDSYAELKVRLAEELARSTGRSQEVSRPAALPLPEALLNATIDALAATRQRNEAVIFERLARRLIEADRVLVFGAGASGVVAQIAAYHLLRLGIGAVAVSDVSWAAELAAGLGRRSVALAVSASGVTETTVRAARIAHQAKVFTIALTNRVDSPLAAVADATLLGVTPEAPTIVGTRTAMASHLLLIEILASAILAHRDTA
jgi:DNA-binding MurR/RpiR family transcriptional regulator